MTAHNTGHPAVSGAVAAGVLPFERPMQNFAPRHLPVSILPQYQGTRVVNIRGNNQQYDVYIGRANQWRKLPASKWANPFKVGKHGTIAEVLAKYRAHVLSRPDLLAALPELEGKRLGCWCAPDDCHGDVLVELLKERGLSQLSASNSRFTSRAVSDTIDRELWRNLTALALPAPRIAGLLPAGIKAAELPTPQTNHAPRLVPMVLSLTDALAWKQATEQGYKLAALYRKEYDWKTGAITPRKERMKQAA